MRIYTKIWAKLIFCPFTYSSNFANSLFKWLSNFEFFDIDSWYFFIFSSDSFVNLFTDSTKSKLLFIICLEVLKDDTGCNKKFSLKTKLGLLIIRLK